MPEKDTFPPTHRVLAVRGEGRRNYFTRIGVAWAHRSGKGFSIRLDAHPIGDTLVLLEIDQPDPEADDADQAPHEAPQSRLRGPQNNRGQGR